MVNEQRGLKQLRHGNLHQHQQLQHHHQIQQQNQTQPTQREMVEDEMEDTDDLTGEKVLEEAVTNISGEVK
jgi:hypothetical protein